MSAPLSPLPDTTGIQRAMLRAFASVVLRDETEIRASTDLIDPLTQAGVLGDGITFDYDYRDSLFRHQSVLSYWVSLVTQTLGLVSEYAFRRMEECVKFMQPYVNGLNSKSSGDNANKALALVWKNSTS